jgi:hypothetical protein
MEPCNYLIFFDGKERLSSVTSFCRANVVCDNTENQRVSSAEGSFRSEVTLLHIVGACVFGWGESTFLCSTSELKLCMAFLSPYEASDCPTLYVQH